MDLTFSHEISEVQLPNTRILRLAGNIDENVLQSLIIVLDDLLNSFPVILFFFFDHAVYFPVFEVFFGDLVDVGGVVFDPPLKNRAILMVLPDYHVTSGLLGEVGHVFFALGDLSLIEEEFWFYLIFCELFLF